MTPTPEITIRVLLKRAAKALPEDLPKFIDAINNLHRLIEAPPPSDLEKRVAKLEEMAQFSGIGGIGAGGHGQGRFR